MKKYILTSLLLLTVISSVIADELSFVASAPKSVVVNQQFRLSYKVNRINVNEPTIPEIKGFMVLSGPGRSTMQSYSSDINGKTTAIASVTFTYTLMAEKEGEFTIPPASIVVDGERLTSNEVAIKVLPEDTSSRSSSSSQRGNGSRGVANTNSTNISNDDLFIRATLNKTKVYEQEAVLLTYKVYSAVNLTNLDFPTPDLKGFHIQEVELPKEKQFELDRYNNRNYQSLIWRQFVLFPQQSGKIEIPSLEFEGVVAVQTRRSMDPFEMMFNGRSSYVEVKKSLKTNRLTLDVEKLPAGRPVGFSGGVGKISISSEISRTKLKTNEETTLKIIVKGVGNMKLIGNPTVSFPSEFEVYDPIINNRFTLKSNGFSGEKVYEYVITPRSSGTFTIPASSLSYFDTASGTYKTVTTEEFIIEVEKGKETPIASATSYIGKERAKVLATDIRHIKLGNAELKPENNTLVASPYYVLFYIIPLLLFIAYIVMYRKKMTENANVSFVRTKKANKVAVKRLKIARILMKENRPDEFYDEILKTLWGYMSDKLSIPVSQLSKENIAIEIGRKGVDESLIKEIQDALNEGEFARYAPGDSEATMDKVFSMSMDVISKLENSIKK